MYSAAARAAIPAGRASALHLYADLTIWPPHFTFARRWTSSAQPWQPACTLRCRLHFHRL